MKTYHEIYPAEGWADKISKFLREVADEKPNMYAKTKKRYEVLACSLLDSVSMISSILEEDSLVPHTNDEFDELSNSSSGMLSDRLERLNSQFRRAAEFDSPRVQKEVEPDSASGWTHRETINAFDRIFKEASIFNFGYSEVNECAKMLYRWYHTRFRPDVPDPEFQFNIHYLPTWICNFIILYGKYHHLQKNDVFVKSIESWCRKVETGQNHTYAIPAEIHEMEKEVEPADYTIDAVVINDLLFGGYLFKLYEDFPGVVHYDGNVLVGVVKERNPSLLPAIRQRIAGRQNLIRQIGLTPVGGGDIDE